MSKYRIDWPRTIGTALASVTAIALLSRLGPIGTLTGAAIASVVVSISTSIFAGGLARAHETVMSVARPGAVAPEEPAAEPVPLASRPVEWKHVWMLAAGLFVVALVLITSFELATGRPLSSYVGAGGRGTSISNLGGGGAAPTPTPTPTPTSTPTPSTSPTAPPSASDSASASPSASSSASPSASGSPSPSVSASSSVPSPLP